MLWSLSTLNSNPYWNITPIHKLNIDLIGIVITASKALELLFAGFFGRWIIAWCFIYPFFPRHLGKSDF